MPLDAVGPRWRTLRVDGARERVLEAGDPGAPPLLFLHGWGLSPRCYADGVTRLTSAGLRVVAPCLPGFGGTDGPALRRVTMAAYAERALALLDALEVDRPAFVVGHSFGGGVALQLAATAPERVRSLTLVNPVGGAALEGPGLLSWARGALEELDPDELTGSAPAMLRDFLPNLLRKPLTLALTARLALTADLAGAAADLVASGMPLLFVWGESDRILAPGRLADVAAALPASSLPVEMVHGRHGWLLSRPGDFAALVHNAVVVHSLMEGRLARRAGGALVLPHGARLDDLVRAGRSA